MRVSVAAVLFPALALALALATVAGCERKKGEILGVGPWTLGKTVLGQATGACKPEKSKTWCTSLQAVKLGEQSAAVDLYFDGHEDDAPLVEILLAVRACNQDSLRSALTYELGDPKEVLDKRLVWTGKSSVIVARFGVTEPTACQVSFVSPSQGRTIEWLKTGTMPPASP